MQCFHIRSDGLKGDNIPLYSRDVSAALFTSVSGIAPTPADT